MFTRSRKFGVGAGGGSLGSAHTKNTKQLNKLCKLAYSPVLEPNDD